MPNHYWEFDMGNLDLNNLYLVSAFLAMEPSDSLISFSRRCGGGFISEEVQQFIWDYCINKFDENLHVPYLKLFLKKLIKEIELTGSNVLDEFYERYAHYMVSLKEDASEKAWIVKCISFIFHDIPSYPGEMQMVVPLQCSLNMLQGDTGCALWPSSLFLSEFVLSFPEVFTRKSCFEVGSGVGLLGVCLNHVNASQVILSDGDASSLANLKINLEMNKIENPEASLDKSTDSSYMVQVQCIHLPWESAKESELQQIKSDIVLGADVIYDPSCLPHLVRVLSIFLNRRKTSDSKLNGSARVDNKEEDCLGDDSTESNTATLQEATLRTLIKEMDIGPVAIIASVIRNIDTFNCFLNLCCQNNLLVRDITKSIRPYNLLPYMESYKRSDVHLLVLSYVS